MFILYCHRYAPATWILGTTFCRQSHALELNREGLHLRITFLYKALGADSWQLTQLAIPLLHGGLRSRAVSFYLVNHTLLIIGGNH
jgi:hypothetical protein